MVPLVALLIFAWAGCAERHRPPIAPISAGGAECGASGVFDRYQFYESYKVTNRWLPLDPGTQFILDGTINQAGTPVPHRVVFTVTDLIKQVNGVQAVVLWDRDYNNNVLKEAELAFHAQDLDGNVWNMGEYPEEYQNGVFAGAPSTWISGVSGAEAGILVPGNPLVGFKYLQGFAPDINFLDCAMVSMLGQTACVPYDCFENVLVVDESSPLEPGSGHQLKYYAPGVGNVQIGAFGDPEAETLSLVSILHLDARALEEARNEALKLEARAYQVSADYRLTQPARPRP